MWRDRRRLMHNAFNPIAVQSFRTLQLECARELLPRLKYTTDVVVELRQYDACVYHPLSTHLNANTLFFRLAGKTIMDIAYGLKVKSKNDPFIAAAEKGVAALLIAGVPGAYLVDSIPLLRYIPDWLPGAGFKKKAREWRKNTDIMVEKPFAAFLDYMVRHPARRSAPC